MELQHYLLLIISPTILILLTIPFLWCRKIDNTTLGLIVCFIPFIGFGVLWWLFNFWIGLFSLFPATGVGMWYTKYLIYIRRCPDCGRMSLKVLSKKEIIEKYNETTHYRRRSSAYDWKFDHIEIEKESHDEYKLWCPYCEKEFDYKTESQSGRKYYS